ncbi:polysaccharide deacetylase family protein [Candidatus Poribacteria bacterium]
MTYYIAAYDTESPNCLAACRKIVDVHHRYEMPATFFVVGKRLDENPTEYREILDDPLFEVASHTYSHRMLKNHPFCGPAATPEQRREEIFSGKASIEKVFERPCLGVRPGCSFVDGLKGAPDVLQLLKDSGLRYASSLAWGPDYSLPALLTEPFSYAEDGFPDLWELPCHGWHDNLLKDNNHWGPRRLTLWPPLMPEGIPPGFLVTPEDEFDVNRVFMEKAIEENKTFVSLIWHPWSLDSFDPDMRMLELTFEHVRRLGLEPCTYADLFQQVSD